MFYSIPIAGCWVYFALLEKKSKKIIEKHLNSKSEIFTDLKVFVRNFDVLKKTDRWDLDPFETFYNYDSCDLILNENYFVVTGKMKIFKRKILLSPTIFKFEQQQENYKNRHVQIEDIQIVGDRVEVRFSDPKYKNKMTLILKNTENRLQKKIHKLSQKI